MRNRYRASLVLISVLVLGTAINQMSLCLGQPYRPRRPPFGWEFTPDDWEKFREYLPLFFTVKGTIATINSIVLLILVVMHIRIYRRTGARFSLGLVVFSMAFLLYTVFANPFLHRLVGFGKIGFGPLLLIPDVFTLIASAILTYLSLQ